MLRNALLIIGVACLALGGLCAIGGFGQEAVTFIMTGCILALGVAWERWRYKPRVTSPHPSWQATGERFIDPETGELTEVYFDAANGARHYVSRVRHPGA